MIRYEREENRAVRRRSWGCGPVCAGHSQAQKVKKPCFQPGREARLGALCEVRCSMKTLFVLFLLVLYLLFFGWQ